LQVTRSEFRFEGFTLPLITISSDVRIGNAVVIHGFGGCKEEQLGLAFRLAELGLDAYTLDLRGHGENTLPLGIEVLDDLNIFIRSLKGSNKTVTIGHSLGGRLALLSEADFRIGISPALSQFFSDQTVNLTNGMRKHRVIEKEENANFRLLRSLPLVDETMGANDLILYGERDIPDIVQGCQALADKGKNVVRLAKAFHGDTFLLEATFSQLETWLINSGRLPGA